MTLAPAFRYPDVATIRTEFAMSIERELRKEAREAAEQAQGRVAQFEREILELEKRLTEAKAKRDATRLAPKRLSNYPITLSSGDYACPVCWIDGKEAALRPVPSSNEDDLFRCRGCGRQFVIQYFC